MLYLEEVHADQQEELLEGAALCCLALLCLLLQLCHRLQHAGGKQGRAIKRVTNEEVKLI